MLHVHLSKVAQVIPEPREVLLQNPAEQLGVGLADDILEGVSVDEGLFDAGMRVQVEVVLYLLVGAGAFNQLNELINCRAEL